MSSAGLVLPPQSSGEFQVADPERVADVDSKHRQVAAWLDTVGRDGLLITDPANFAWFTSGGTCAWFPGEAPRAALLITREARVVLCSNMDSAELFDCQLTGLGFQLKERPWTQPLTLLLDDILRGRNLGADRAYPGAVDVSETVARWRLTLGPLEQARLGVLARQVTHAVEATARTIVPGLTEAEIAAQVSHRLLKHEVVPVRVEAACDGRGRLYRRWAFGADRLRSWVVLSAMGSMWGLHAACSRIVCFGNPPDELASVTRHVAMLSATARAFSQAGLDVPTVCQKVRRIYEKLNQVNEWSLAEQAEAIGFSPQEYRLVPDSSQVLTAGQAIYWHPSIGPVRGGETVLVTDRGGETVTVPESWPVQWVQVREQTLPVPDLLCRESG